MGGEIEARALFPAIAADGLAEFKDLAAKAIAATADEPGTLQYDWWYDADEAACVVRERYAGSDAVLAHLGNVGPLLGRLVELGGGLELEVYGDPSADLRAATAALRPKIYTFGAGT